MLVNILVIALVSVAVFLVLATTIALWRAPDALTRANVMGPTTGVAVPLLLIAKMLYDAAAGNATPNDIVRGILAIIGLLIVASVAAFYMGRSLRGLSEEESAAAAELD